MAWRIFCTIPAASFSRKVPRPIISSNSSPPVTLMRRVRLGQGCLQFHYKVNLAVEFIHFMKLNNIFMLYHFENLYFGLYHILFSLAFGSVDNFDSKLCASLFFNHDFDLGKGTAKYKYGSLEDGKSTYVPIVSCRSNLLKKVWEAVG